ncbi:hypothetical protein F4692_003300 [Nocardioides cavernae]|uniref:DUF3592 domain-containing protein n=1 Tax=Nocardioides cavernae TaxID=1921566 RepID=A0A7Y9KT43_9ACTN|nr:DUF3592 domain-containing protein [Nocardioides cavernae]NYE38155.1 hypothetical protein [Nocardioides cavernae]
MKFLFALVCTALPAYGLLLGSRSRARQRSWIPTVGSITRLRTTSGSDVASGSASLVADYEYVDPAGVVRRGRGSPGSRGVPVGAGPRPINLLVNPHDPSTSVIAGSSDVGSRLFAVLCSGFFVVGIILTIDALNPG